MYVCVCVCVCRYKHNYKVIEATSDIVTGGMISLFQRTTPVNRVETHTSPVRVIYATLC